MDECAVNRKLIKIHQRSNGLIHKVLNPFVIRMADAFISSLIHLTYPKLHRTAWLHNAEIFGYGT